MDLVAHVVERRGITSARDRARAATVHRMSALGAGLANDLDFTCPRCAQPARERVYGPCQQCRAQLRASVAGTARELAVEEYTPKMNVTPNAVASKE